MMVEHPHRHNILPQKFFFIDLYFFLYKKNMKTNFLHWYQTLLCAFLVKKIPRAVGLGIAVVSLHACSVNPLDTSPPQITLTLPASTDTANAAKPLPIILNFADNQQLWNYSVSIKPTEVGANWLHNTLHTQKYYITGQTLYANMQLPIPDTTHTGKYELKLVAQDRSGNTADTVSQFFYLKNGKDSLPPTLNLISPLPNSNNQVFIITSDIVYIANIADNENGSGIKSVFVRIYDAANKLLYTSLPFQKLDDSYYLNLPAPTLEGVYKSELVAIDSVNNKTIKSFYIIVN